MLPAATPGHDAAPPGTRRRYLRLGLWATVGALVAVTALSPFRWTAGPFTVTVALRVPGRGETRVQVPPAGEVWARTHRSPLDVSVRLERVDLDGLERLARDRGQLGEALARQSRQAARLAVARLLALSLVGGALGPVLAGERGREAPAAGALIGLGQGAALAAATVATFDPRAFAEPRFSGALEAAPWLIPAIQEGLARLPQWRAHFRLLAAHLAGLFRRLERLPPLAAPGASLTVLAVADVHNSPVGMEFVVRTVERFRPDLVVDAGDLTDYGTALEAHLLRQLATLRVPYVLVPGNHEGPAALAQLRTLPPVRVLTGGRVRIRGLTIAGLADPLSGSPSPAEPDPAAIEAARAALRGLAAGTGDRPPADLVVVHHPRIGEAVLGHVPALVTGHTHRPRLAVVDGTVWVDPGSAGAAGLRGLLGAGRIPYALALLHFARTPGGWRVVAVDTVRVDAAEVGYRVERHLVGEPGLAGPPAGPGEPPGP